MQIREEIKRLQIIDNKILKAYHMIDQMEGISSELKSPLLSDDQVRDLMLSGQQWLKTCSGKCECECSVCYAKKFLTLFYRMRHDTECADLRILTLDYKNAVSDLREEIKKREEIHARI